MLPWPIIKMIADLTGEPWRVRVCRKLRSMIPFPEVRGNVVDYEPNLPFHPSRIVKVSSCWADTCDYAALLAPPCFIIVWLFDPFCECALVTHMSIDSKSYWPNRGETKNMIEKFFKKIK
jgi:hypothetical protein